MHENVTTSVCTVVIELEFNEKQNAKLQHHKWADGERDRRLVDSLVDFAWYVAKVQVVAIYQVFEDHVEKTERRDDWTHHWKGQGDCKHGQDPCILNAVVELQGHLLSDIVALDDGAGPAHFEQVEQQIGDAQQIDGGSDQTECCDILDEIGAVVGDAAPLDVLVLVWEPLKDCVDACQAECGQYEGHE